MSVDRHSYVAFYPSDWIGGTARMTPMQELIYFRICCFIWDKAEPCPAAELPLLLGQIQGWEDILGALIAAGKLARTPVGSLVNYKALSEGKKALSLWGKKSQGGKKGAAKTNAADSPAMTPDGNAADSPAMTPDENDAGVPPQNQNQNQTEPPLPPQGGGAKESVSVLRETPSALPNAAPPDATSLERCYAAAGIDPSRMASPAWHVRQRKCLDEWIAKGCDLERDILPTITAKLAEATEPIGSLRFFDAAILQAHDRRVAREPRKRKHDWDYTDAEIDARWPEKWRPFRRALRDWTDLARWIDAAGQPVDHRPPCEQEFGLQPLQAEHPQLDDDMPPIPPSLRRNPQRSPNEALKGASAPPEELA